MHRIYEQAIEGSLDKVRISWDGRNTQDERNLMLGVYNAGIPREEITLATPSLIQGFLAATLLGHALGIRKGKPTLHNFSEGLEVYTIIVNDWYEKCVVNSHNFDCISTDPTFRRYDLYVRGVAEAVASAQSGIEFILQESSLQEMDDILRKCEHNFNAKEILYVLARTPERLVLGNSNVKTKSSHSDSNVDPLCVVAQRVSAQDIFEAAKIRYGDNQERQESFEYNRALRLAAYEVMAAVNNAEVAFPDQRWQERMAISSLDRYVKSPRDFSVSKNDPKIEYVRGSSETMITFFDENIVQRDQTNGLRKYSKLLQTTLRVGLIYYLFIENADPDLRAEQKPASLQVLQSELEQLTTTSSN